MSCSCVYVDDGDFESPSIYNSKVVRARKEHTCYECGQVIKPGEMYENVKALYNGSWSRFVTCNDCLSVRNSFFCGTFMHGSIWEYLDEHLHETVTFDGAVSSDCIVKLTPHAREKVCERIEQIWNDLEDD